MRPLACLLGSVLALASVAPAAASWLVTHDGTEIETEGSWEIRGALVVFQQPGGKLASMRLSEIDLGASEARSAAPTAPEVVEKRQSPVASGPVMVLTDADVRHVRPGDSLSRYAAEADEAQAPESQPAAEPERERAPAQVEVTGWRDQVNVEAGVLELTGSLLNRGTSVATDTRVRVSLLDGSGGVVEERYATIGGKVLGPGSTVPFEVSFPGSPAYESVEFDIRSRGFRMRPAAQAAEETD